MYYKRGKEFIIPNILHYYIQDELHSLGKSEDVINRQLV